MRPRPPRRRNRHQEKGNLDVGAQLDRGEAPSARNDQRGVDLTLDQHVVARLSQVNVDLSRRAGRLRLAPLERPAQPGGRNRETNAATVEVEVVDGDDESAAIRHGTSIKAMDLFCQRRQHFPVTSSPYPISIGLSASTHVKDAARPPRDGVARERPQGPPAGSAWEGRFAWSVRRSRGRMATSTIDLAARNGQSSASVRAR